MSQIALAEKIGVEQPGISLVENGKQEPCLRYIELLALGLDVTLSKMFKGFVILIIVHIIIEKLRIRHLDGYLVLDFPEPHTETKKMHLHFQNQEDLIMAMRRVNFSEKHISQVECSSCCWSGDFQRSVRAAVGDHAWTYRNVFASVRPGANV